MGGRPLGTVFTTIQLEPSEYEDVSSVWNRPTHYVEAFDVAVDDDGTGEGTVEECDEVNNDPSIEVDAWPHMR